MAESILITLLGMIIDLAVVCTLVFCMSIGFKFDFTMSLGISVWSATLLVRWVLKLSRQKGKQ